MSDKIIGLTEHDPEIGQDIVVRAICLKNTVKNDASKSYLEDGCMFPLKHRWNLKKGKAEMTANAKDLYLYCIDSHFLMLSSIVTIGKYVSKLGSNFESLRIIFLKMSEIF